MSFRLPGAKKNAAANVPPEIGNDGHLASKRHSRACDPFGMGPAEKERQWVNTVASLRQSLVGEIYS